MDPWEGREVHDLFGWYMSFVSMGLDFLNSWNWRKGTAQQTTPQHRCWNFKSLNTRDMAKKSWVPASAWCGKRSQRASLKLCKIWKKKRAKEKHPSTFGVKKKTKKKQIGSITEVYKLVSETDVRFPIANFSQFLPDVRTFFHRPLGARCLAFSETSQELVEPTDKKKSDHQVYLF